MEQWDANFDLHDSDDSESCQITHRSRLVLIAVVGNWYLRGNTGTES